MSKALVEARVRHRLGSLEMDVAFAVTRPWTVLFGPSGSGKSTVLRMLAGLVRPGAGRVLLQGVVVCDMGAKTWLPAHRREVRWAGQRAALFPGKTVRANVGMGLQGGGAQRGRVLEEALDLFGLRGLADKMPGELSGGERQRVSVVRAAVGARGKVLLLDEPFAGLDARVREELIAGLRAWLPSTPVVSVTHDVGEAFLLTAEVVRMEGGRVVAQGAAGEVLGAERERLRRVLG